MDMPLTYEPVLGGGFLLSSPEIEVDVDGVGNFTLVTRLLMQDGGMRKDMYMTAAEADVLGDVKLPVWNHDDDNLNYLTASMFDFDVQDASSRRYINTTRVYDDDDVGLGPSMFNPDTASIIVSRDAPTDFAEEGPYQVVVCSKAKASLVTWGRDLESIRVRFADLEFEAGETKVISTFALFDQANSVGHVQRGFAVWDSLESIEKNFPFLAQGLPEDRGIILNW
eukprot:m.295009 g.295009  ORF g.295009 m.295009 type:complete len:225 (+) comp53142_c0_seq1:668-1342(+)